MSACLKYKLLSLQLIPQFPDIDVVVLDANQRAALAVVRSLGARGLRIGVADVKMQTLAGSSKFCRARLVYPDPSTLSGDFVEWIVELARQHPHLVFQPVSDLTVPLCIAAINANSAIRACLPNASAYSKLTDKYSLVRLAEEAGLSCPKTISVGRHNQEEVVSQAFHFPVVIKPQLSATKIETGRVIKRTVMYAHDRESLRRLIDCQLQDSHDRLLVQEKIEGPGIGVFMFYVHGQRKAVFGHQRLREKPPTGGVSVLCESKLISNDLLRKVTRLLDCCAWHGPAMVEAKLDRNGHPWIIEVNGRLWGSVQLAIDCAVDFPWYSYLTAIGSTFDAPHAYVTGRQLRWLLGDLDSLYLLIRARNIPMFAKLSAIARFMVPWVPGRRLEILRKHDLAPAIFAIREYVRQLVA